MRRALPLVLALAAASAAPAARLHFDETMTGRMRWGQAPAQDAARVSLHLRLATPDTDAFFADPTHPMEITGRLVVRPASGGARDYPVHQGEFFFLAPGAGDDERVMIYRFAVRSGARELWFEGVKTLRDDDGADAIGDTTRLISRLRRGGPDGPVIAAGLLRFRWHDPVNMARFLGSFRVRGTSWWGKVKVLRRFLRLYLGTLAELYL